MARAAGERRNAVMDDDALRSIIHEIVRGPANPRAVALLPGQAASASAVDHPCPPVRAALGVSLHELDEFPLPRELGQLKS